MVVYCLAVCKRTVSLIINSRQFDYFGHPNSKIVQNNVRLVGENVSDFYLHFFILFQN